MTLSFPNQSRSYDAHGRRVRFWGTTAHSRSVFSLISALSPA